jgi:protein-S-isoprenylcysteine O-methyltransferase Ste14
VQTRTLETTTSAAKSVPTRSLIRAGQFFFKFRDYLFPLVFLPVAIGTRPRMFLGDPRADVWLDVAGLLLLAGGQTLRALVIGLCYIQRGGQKKKIHAAKLLQEGLFAHSRNPLYVGNLMMVTGLVLLHNGPWMYFVVLPFFLFVYISIVAAEETFLRREFGAEYAEYCRRVPRFLPNLTGIAHTFAHTTFDWKRVIRLEHAPSFAAFSAAILILAWERISAEGYAAEETQVRVLAIVWIGMIAAYVCVRVLKKRGALQSA